MVGFGQLSGFGRPRPGFPALFGLVVSPYPTLERQEQTGTVLLRLRQSTPRRCCVHTELSLQWCTVSDCNDLGEVCAQADSVGAGGVGGIFGGVVLAVSSAQRLQQLVAAAAFEGVGLRAAAGTVWTFPGVLAGELLAKFFSSAVGTVSGALVVRWWLLQPAPAPPASPSSASRVSRASSYRNCRGRRCSLLPDFLGLLLRQVVQVAAAGALWGGRGAG